MYLTRDKIGYVLSETQLIFDADGNLLWNNFHPIDSSMVEESGFSLLVGKSVKVRFEVIE